MRTIPRLIALSFLVTIAPTALLAQTTKPETGNAPKFVEDAKALAAEMTRFTQAFNAGDSSTIAAMFTDDARIVGEDGSTRGREAIKARFEAYFKENPKAKILIQPEEVVFVSPDVALEDGRAIVSPAETGSQPESSRYSVVYVRQAGKWLQSSLREFAGEEPAVPDRLKDLEWLVGEWVNESHEAVVSSSCRWSDDKHFLLRDFTIHVRGKAALKGSQRIGWDPVAKQIRSWVFDSEGGFGEGYWSRVGDTWMIKTSGVRKDGKTATATQVITRNGPDHVRWASFDRTSGGDLVPDLDQFTLVRQPPKPSEVKTK